MFGQDIKFFKQIYVYSLSYIKYVVQHIKTSKNISFVKISVVSLTMIVEQLFFLFLFSVCGAQPAVSARNDSGSIEVFPGSTSCEGGWLDASLVDLGCLYFSELTKVYYDANKFCQDKGSHLIEIHTRAQMDFIKMELELNDEAHLLI